MTQSSEPLFASGPDRLTDSFNVTFGLCMNSCKCFIMLFAKSSITITSTFGAHPGSFDVRVRFVWIM